jgi:hypothetical protein
MPTLTRRRSPDAREECWHIYYGDVRAGMIAERTGNPHDQDRRQRKSGQSRCGYPVKAAFRRFRKGKTIMTNANILADAELDAVVGGIAISTSTNKAGGSARPNDAQLPQDPVITAGETAIKVAGGALWALLF